MSHDIHPTLSADSWGYARALSLELDFQFQPLLVRVMGEPNLDGKGFKFHRAIGALGLVKPFDWPNWKMGPVTKDVVSTLDDDTAWRHVTRIVRSDRICEGNFDGHVANGTLTALVRHIHLLRRTENGRPLNFPMLDDGSVEPGIRLVSETDSTIGYTTGAWKTCDADSCSRWSVEIQLLNGARQFRCSEQWHFVYDTMEMYQLPHPPHVPQFRARPSARL